MPHKEGRSYEETEQEYKAAAAKEDAAEQEQVRRHSASESAYDRERLLPDLPPPFGRAHIGPRVVFERSAGVVWKDPKEKLEWISYRGLGQPLLSEDVEKDVLVYLGADQNAREDLYKRGVISHDLYQKTAPGKTVKTSQRSPEEEAILRRRLGDEYKE